MNPVWRTMARGGPEPAGVKRAVKRAGPTGDGSDGAASTTPFVYQTVGAFDTAHLAAAWSEAHRIDAGGNEDALAPEVRMRQRRFEADNRRPRVRAGELPDEAEEQKERAARRRSARRRRRRARGRGKAPRGGGRMPSAARGSDGVDARAMRAHKKQLEDVFWTNALLSPLAAPLDHGVLLPEAYRDARPGTRLMFQPDAAKRARARAQRRARVPLRPARARGGVEDPAAPAGADRGAPRPRRRAARLFRAHAERQRVRARRREVLRAVPELQRAARGMLARRRRRRLLDRRRNLLAVRVQRVVRGRWGRAAAAAREARKQNAQAMRIQSAVRGYLWRQAVRRRRTEDAAPIVQRYMMGLATRGRAPSGGARVVLCAAHHRHLPRGAGPPVDAAPAVRARCKASIVCQRRARAARPAVRPGQAPGRAHGAARRAVLPRTARVRADAPNFENDFCRPKGEAEHERTERFLRTADGKRYFKEAKAELKAELGGAREAADDGPGHGQAARAEGDV